MQRIEDNRWMTAEPTSVSVLSVCNDSENRDNSVYGTDAAFVASFFAFLGMNLFYRFYNSVRFYFDGYYGYHQFHRIPCKNKAACMSWVA